MADFVAYHNRRTLDGVWLFETTLERVFLTKRAGSIRLRSEFSGAEAAMALLRSANAVAAFRSFNLG